MALRDEGKDITGVQKQVALEACVSGMALGSGEWQEERLLSE